MEAQGRAQALAGGAAGAGGRERAAAAQTKPAAAADGTVMLLSLGASAGTPRPPRYISTDPCSASHPRLLGATSAKPSALLLVWGEGQGEGISSCRDQGLRGLRAAPQPRAPHQHPHQGHPCHLPGPPGKRQMQGHDPDPAPAWAAPCGSRDPAGNSWARAALLVITN